MGDPTGAHQTPSQQIDGDFASAFPVDHNAIFAVALERCTSMVVVANLAGIIQWVNLRFCQVTGYEAKEIIGCHTRVLGSGHTSRTAYLDLWNSITTGRPWTGEFHNRRKDGSLHWVSATISPIHDDRGKVAGFLAIEDDITESKATRDALRRTEQRLATALEAIDDGFALYSADERLELCNERYLKVMGAVAPFIKIGQTYEEILREGLRRNLYDGVHGDPEVWLQKRLQTFRDANREDEQLLHGGIWVRASDRPTSDGGRVALRTDITALKRTQQELSLAKDAADRANRAKSTFLSNMSHELRTPLNAILGFSQMLRMHPNEHLTPLQDQCVGNILEAGEHLLHLINEVLDLARIEAGKLDLHPEAVCLPSLIEECLDMLRPQAEAKKLVISSVFPIDPPPALADSLRLKQVFINLLSNAIKYNSDGGRIVVACGADGDRCWLSVSDSGIGIAKEMQDRLFTPFDRLGIESQHVNGTGIGLAITRQLIEMMGGSISCISVPGEGSTFRLELPVFTIQQGSQP